VETPERPRVVVSIQPVRDLVSRIAGEDLDTVLVLRPGREAHTFSPSPRDVARLEGAALSIAVGLGLDDWSTRAAEQASDTPPHTLRLGPALDPVAGDPHLWLDPERMARAAELIAVALSEVLPERAPDLSDRAVALAGSLRELDREIALRSRSWPRRALVTAHPFLSYYAERYDLEIVGVIETEPGRGLTPGTRGRLLDSIRQREVAAIVAQAEDDVSMARSVSEEVDVPLCVLHPLGRAEGESYETTLRALTDTLEGALR
jgi:ABC-type Zn uptake system ZnuABC Zn-binding protein ZnuA